jgi:hypothetical protein
MTGGMKNPQKKVLPFTKPPEQPKVSTIIVQMFGQRMAIHCAAEELPPLPPLLQFKRPGKEIGPKS